MKPVLESWIELPQMQTSAEKICLSDVKESSQEDLTWMEGEMRLEMDSISRTSKPRALCANGG